jgi:hypothetical protein
MAAKNDRSKLAVKSPSNLRLEKKKKLADSDTDQTGEDDISTTHREKFDLLLNDAVLGIKQK